ncbi:SAM dependent carboxyl methyltransferase [Dillenia turbinata]|uniref:SAM dependent carboxyl methyltransferase n=1 Tax=Dillenia turbinata TaxID=194707 RepID=A0AAN8ZFX3_9MAGN
MEEAIIDFYGTNFPDRVGVADLGCSSGPNCLLALSEILDTIFGVCNNMNRPTPEIIAYLNDLPGNDFNSIFGLLPAFHQTLKEEKGSDFGPCFLSGMPGSFYGRLLPRNTLHFVHSSSGLHWLSQICCRYIVLVLSQGVIEKEKIDSFDAPYYAPCPEELETQIEKEGSFIIDRLEAFEIEWDGGEGSTFAKDHGRKCDTVTRGQRVSKITRAVVESMIESHFGVGEDVMDDLFRRYADVVDNHFLKTKATYANIIITLTKKC